MEFAYLRSLVDLGFNRISSARNLTKIQPVFSV